MQLTKELRNFIIVTTVFAVISIVMSLSDVNNPWIWGIFIILWAIVEWIFARDIHLKAWHWVMLIGGLSLLNIIIGYAF